MISSSFDRTTLKLLVATFLLMDGASVATAHAQDAAADPLLGLRGVVVDPPSAPMDRRALIQGTALQVGPANQPDAVASCPHPNVAPAPGLGMGGLAISNSTPAAETTEHVDQAVDALNLF